MPRALKPRDATGEMIEADDQTAEAEPKPPKHGHERMGLSVKLAKERHTRLVLQNQKLRAEQRAREGGLVELAAIQRTVLQANATVKTHLLTLPGRLAGDLSTMTDPFAIRALLKKAITEALNELAYEHGAT
jgi:hypothetical protein